MTPTANFQLGTMLDRYMREKGLSNLEVGKELHLHPITIGKIRNGKSNPHHETRDMIEMYLQENGAMTGLGFPTEIQPPAVTEEKVLEDMGIKSTLPKKHYVCGFLDDRQFLRFLQLIQALPQDEAEKFLGILCASDFPSLS